jgi:small subunit ribosomal protein S20
MPILRHAKKALRVAERRAEENRFVKARLKTFIDKVEKAKPATTEILSEAFSAIDMAAKKFVIHHNKAARIKSRLSKLVK